MSIYLFMFQGHFKREHIFVNMDASIKVICLGSGLSLLQAVSPLTDVQTDHTDYVVYRVFFIFYPAAFPSPFLTRSLCLSATASITFKLLGTVITSSHYPPA